MAARAGDLRGDGMTTVTFGLNVGAELESTADPARAAREAEDLGFDFVSVNDHPGNTDPVYETWTMLAWMAAATSRLTIAPRVLGVPFRSPPLVAKMAETLQRLSGGRLILGLGGGSGDGEFRAFGLGVPSTREKVDGLEDAIRITKGLWSERDFTYEGRRYRTERANLEPKPERPIPIWTGTLGPRGLAITGRLADGWIPSLELAPPERAREMRDRILAAAEEAGRDPEAITCCYNLDVRIHADADEPEHIVAGPGEQVVERLASFIEMGFTSFNVFPVGPGREEQIQRLAREVMPAVRSGI
jgi:alkanesulfonate monooxygenase SsuD/methylene tetrahydromethanopterin reductase-like flavin-dependent oxidoreductase (luciferase family)